MVVTSFARPFSMWTCWPLDFPMDWLMKSCSRSLPKPVSSNQTNLLDHVNVFIPKERNGNDEGWVWALTSMRALLLHQRHFLECKKVLLHIRNTSEIIINYSQQSALAVLLTIWKIYCIYVLGLLVWNLLMGEFWRIVLDGQENVPIFTIFWVF